MSNNDSVKDIFSQYQKARQQAPSDVGSSLKITPKDTEERFKEKMGQIALKEKERMVKAQAMNLGVPYIDLKGFPISPETLGMISEEEASRLRVICFLYTGEELRIATTQPQNSEIKNLLRSLEEKFHTHGVVYLVSEHSLQTALKLYIAIPRIRKVEKGVTITEEELQKFQKELTTFHELNDKIQGASITDLVTMIIASAIEARASDIHIEAEEKDIKTRFRIDGVLHDVAELEKKIWPRVISRVKLLAGLKINIEDKPQDGRFTIHLAQEKIDVRVSTLPTAFGESVVMRLLMSKATGLAFGDLGLRGRAFDQLKRETERPNGMIITTGPTGSGKTTTLYAILNKLNNPETKIITIEDPIEYELKGINQSQVDPSRDYTFTKGLRSIVRQDPDIIMVGEIRDLETAEIAIQAALTGHLVLSTIHTNDAAGTIPRFLSMGAKPFLLAPALNAMIGQRLVRRLCKACKEEAKPDEEKLKRARELLAELSQNSDYEVHLDNLKFYQGKGCEACQNLGFKGRIGIYEIMLMGPEVEKVILSAQVSEYVMRDIAIKNGMITMVQDGLLKALDGITTLEEVFRVTE